MDTNKALTLARELMDAHGLGHVSLNWHRSNASLGFCHHKRADRFSPWRCTEITLSRGLVSVNKESTIRDTILHEIAHALAEHTAGHGPLWKLQCIAIGARPEARCGLGVVSVPTKIKAICPVCQHPHYFTRMPVRERYCICQKRTLRQNWQPLNPERIG